MTNRVTQTFTAPPGTDVTTIAGLVAAIGFTYHSVIDSTGGRVRAGASGGQVVFATTKAAADGEYSDLTVDWVTVAGGVAAMTRAGNVGGVPVGYMLYLTGTTAQILRLDNSTTIVAQGSSVSHTPTVGTNVYRIKATGTGSSVLVEAFVDGTPLVSVTDETAGRLTAFGSCGLYFDTTNSETAGAHPTLMTQEDPNAASSAALTLTNPAAGRIFQRAAGVGTIAVDGTYTGAPTSIQARLVLDGTSTAVSGFDWSTKVASPSGNAFSFNFASAPENVWYNVQIRDSATPGTVVTSGKVGVGALFPLLGQSNAWLWFARGDSSLTPDAKLRVIGSGGDNGIASTNVAKTWSVPASASMNGAIAFGNRLVSLLNTLVGVIDVTWDGSGLTVPGNGGQWIPTAAAGQPYLRAKTFLNTITAKIEAAVVVNGEADGASGVTQANFYAGMGALISALRADFGSSTTPIITPLLGKRTDGSITDANAQLIRNAQVQKAGDTGVYRVERVDLTRNADGIHLDPAGFTKLGIRCAQAACYALGAASYYRGPAITSVVRVDATHYDVVIGHSGGSDFNPSAALTEFAAADNGTPITVTSAVRQTASTIRLALASDPVAPPSISYGYGTQPDITGALHDNSPLALPLEFNGGVVASDVSFATTVSFAVKDLITGNDITGLVNLDFAIFDQERFNGLLAPIKKGSTLAVNNGSASVDITGLTTLSPGDTALVIAGPGDGSKALIGQVVVS